jgi:RNA polymerase sigma factor (TIGR02999 family)
MSEAPQDDITELLAAWSRGDPDALARLTPIVYRELHRVAQRHMKHEQPGHTLQPTALVNEAYLKLVDCNRVRWQNRTHFFAVASQLMRRILVDFARNRGTWKRGSGMREVSLADAAEVGASVAPDLVALDDALESLAKIDPRKANVVELRFFGGLSLEETAEVLGVSVDTIGRDWNTAKAWLLRELLRNTKAGNA